MILTRDKKEKKEETEIEREKRLEKIKKIQQLSTQLGISESVIKDAKLLRISENTAKKMSIYLDKVCNITGEDREVVFQKMNAVRRKYKMTFKGYCINRLYNMNEEEMEAFFDERKKHFEEDMKLIMDATGWTQDEIVVHLKECKEKYHISRGDYIIFKAWQLSDEELDSFATLSTSTKLNLHFNKNPKELYDKEIFLRKNKEYVGRKFWINRETNFEEFSQFIKGLSLIFVKPMDSSKGRGVEKIVIGQKDIKELYEDLIGREPILVEEFIYQHPRMNELFDGCVNTIRLVTILKDGKCHHVGGFLKIGRNKDADSMLFGGMYAAIDEKTGKLITPAINSRGETFTKHPVTGKEILGFEIPHWDKVLELTEKIQRANPNNCYVGWDIAVRADDVVIVEGNSRGNLGSYQATLAPQKKGVKAFFESFLN